MCFTSFSSLVLALLLVWCFLDFSLWILFYLLSFSLQLFFHWFLFASSLRPLSKCCVCVCVCVGESQNHRGRNQGPHQTCDVWLHPPSSHKAPALPPWAHITPSSNIFHLPPPASTSNSKYRQPSLPSPPKISQKRAAHFASNPVSPPPPRPQGFRCWICFYFTVDLVYSFFSHQQTCRNSHPESGRVDLYQDI